MSEVQTIYTFLVCALLCAASLGSGLPVWLAARGEAERALCWSALAALPGVVWASDCLLRICVWKQSANLPSLEGLLFMGILVGGGLIVRSFQLLPWRLASKAAKATRTLHVIGWAVSAYIAAASAIYI